MSRRRRDEAAADRWRERIVVELLAKALKKMKENESRKSTGGTKGRTKKRKKPKRRAG